MNARTHYDSVTRVTRNLSPIVNVTCFSREGVLFTRIFTRDIPRTDLVTKPEPFRLAAFYFENVRALLSDENSHTTRETPGNY